MPIFVIGNPLEHLQPKCPLRDRVEKEFLAQGKPLDISCPLNNPLLPTKMLILLATACLVWIGILSLAFMVFTGTGISAGWIFAGALFAALAVWVVLMFREFQHALHDAESFEDDCDDCELYLGYGPGTLRSGLRRTGLRIFSGRRQFSSGRRDEGSGKETRTHRKQRPIRPTFR